MIGKRTALHPEDGRLAEPRAERSAGLDGLRAAAALLVAIFHLRLVLGIDFGPANFLVEGGDAGIYVFFALSGYLLYRPFLYGDVDLRAYAIKRAARILPGYLIALLALTVLTRSPLPFEHPIAYLTMTSSYYMDLRVFLGNAWTLSAEVVFYLVLPAVAWLVKGREILRLCMVASASIALALAYLIAGSPINWLFGSFPLVAYAFVPGMVLAVVEYRHRSLFALLGSPLALGLGVVLILVETQTRGFPVTIAAGVGSPLLIGWLVLHRMPGAKYLAFFGGASYAMYLWHKDLYSTFGALGFVISLIGAAASWAFLERPILDAAHRQARRWREATRRLVAQARVAAAADEPSDQPAVAHL